MEKPERPKERYVTEGSLGKPINVGAIKAWTPIIASLLAFLGMVVVALIQTSGATKSDVNTIVKVMNENVIPAIQKTLDNVDSKLDKECLDRVEEIAALRERLARLEGKLGMQGFTENKILKDSIAKLKSSIVPTSAFNPPKPKKEQLPMLQEAK